MKRRSFRKRQAVEKTTTFMNVDLDLEAAETLADLVRALGPVYVLRQTTEAPFVANLEVEKVGLDCGQTIELFLDRIEDLDDWARELWDRCASRTFDIGIQAGLEPQKTAYLLPPSLLRRVAVAGAQVVVTVYGTKQFAGGS